MSLYDDMAGVIGYHQNGEGDRCERCGRTFPPGQVGHYSYKNKLHDWCENCKRKVILEGK